MSAILKNRWFAIIALFITLLALLATGLIPGISRAQAAGPITVTPTADTYVQADRPTENFGTSVRWSTEGRNAIWRNSLLRFNVPVPADEKVVSAKLRAYSETATTATEFVDVYNTLGTWSETGATWNNAPARGTWLDKQGGFAAGQWVEWNVTSNIGDGGFVNFKLESGAQKWIGFKSKDSTDPAFRPQLVVTTEPKVVVTPTPTPTPTETTPPASPTGDLNDTGFTYTGVWSSGPCAGCFQGDNKWTNETNATYSQKFSGNKVELYSEKNSALGIFAVSIDGGAEVLVDPYNASRQDNVLVWSSPILTEGEHTVTVRNTGTKNAASTGTYTVADRVKAISGAVAEPTTPPTTPPATGDGTTAATTLNWGQVLRGDEFNYTGAPNVNKWEVYGDYAGHAGNGMRLQNKSTVNGSALRIDGDTNGNTGGVKAKFDQNIQPYYRLESRMRTSARDPEYHPVMLMWADNVDGGQTITAVPEIDYAEGVADPTKINFYLHWNNTPETTSASKVLDTREWHNYAVEWTSQHVIGYIDGVEWFRDTNTSHVPQTPMHSNIQLDWFPDDSAAANPAASWMEVDWTREYAVDGGTTPTTPPTTPPTGGTWDLAIVGDMNGERTSSPTSASGKNASSIKAALDNGSVDNFFGVGDLQYSEGTCSSASNSYFGFWEGLWGGTKSKMYWNAAPNHDYQTGRNTDFDNWMNGECVSTVKAATNTDPTRKNRNTQNGQPAGFQEALEWYSVDRGNWHMLSASSAAWRDNPTLANRQTAEIDRDLTEARAAGKHIVVMLHEPYFGSTTSAHGRELDSKPWIDVFYKNKVKVLLSGSQHNYERTCPVNNNDACVADGMQMFQVSTGGIGLRTFNASAPSYSQNRFTGTWGWLKMSLNDNGSYTWDYQPTSGTMTNDDNGSRQ